MSNLQQRLTALRARGITMEALAPHTPFASSTLRNLLCGSNPETDAMRRGLLPVIERFERGEISAYSPPPGSITVDDMRTVRPARVHKQGKHYDIAITRKIAVALSYCYEQATLGCITADYGAGKSHAIDAWRRAHREVESAVIEFVEVTTGNRCAFIHELAEILGVRVASGGTVAANRVYRAIVDHLRAHPLLLIFDQCEGARVGVLQVVRQLWDATEGAGVGMCLFGAHRLNERLRVSRSQDLGALTSRLEPWDALPGVMRGEMEQILAHEGITDIDQAATDLLWAGVDGSTRLLMKAVRMIQVKHGGKPVRKNTVAAILGFLRGVRISND